MGKEMQINLQNVKSILVKYTEVDQEEILPDSRLTSDLGLTSFDLVCLSASLEDAFEIKLNEEVVKKAQTVQNVIDALNK